MEVREMEMAAVRGGLGVIEVLLICLVAQIIICYPLLRRMGVSKGGAWLGVVGGVVLAAVFLNFIGIAHYQGGRSTAWLFYIRVALLAGVGSAALVPALVAVYRMLMSAPTAAQGPAPGAYGGEDAEAARQRILDMVAEGRITAAEGSELMQAVSVSAAQSFRPVSPPVPPSQRLIVVGAVLVLVGFFLPWMRVDLGREMSRTMQNFGGIPGMAANMPQISTGKQAVSGGDTEQGWAILICAAFVALLPVIPLQVTAETRRFLTLAGWALGAFLVVYLAHDTLRYASIGLYLVIGGYILQALALARDHKRLPAHAMAM